MNAVFIRAEAEATRLVLKQNEAKCCGCKRWSITQSLKENSNTHSTTRMNLILSELNQR